MHVWLGLRRSTSLEIGNLHVFMYLVVNDVVENNLKYFEGEKESKPVKMPPTLLFFFFLASKSVDCVFERFHFLILILTYTFMTSVG